MITRRSALGVAAVVLCTTVLAWRLRTVAREPHVAVNRRVAQLMNNRLLAQRIAAYAQTYDRPAYHLDSVVAHLDSPDRRLVSELRTDLWGAPVLYLWSWCSFRLMSPGGRTGRASGRLIMEDYPWPPGVAPAEKCSGRS
ncbi:MAG: hypothetical protein WKG32_20235 [Gemmatimonadaceae bacterium]